MVIIYSLHTDVFNDSYKMIWKNTCLVLVSLLTTTKGNETHGRLPIVSRKVFKIKYPHEKIQMNVETE